MTAVEPRHLIGERWERGTGTEALDVLNPATGGVIAELVTATDAEVDAAVAAAAEAFPAWSALPITERAQIVLRMKVVLEDNAERLAHQLTLDQGKTLAEARGEVRRSIEGVESAASAPLMVRGDKVMQVASGVDTELTREPLGVCVAITPFNFPVMNPVLFTTWALVCGNTLVVKPSELDPLVSTLTLELLQQAGVPPGVLGVVHGGRAVVERLIAHPQVAAVSAIASTPTARAIYAGAATAGKRVQANGGAKNPIVVMPDASMAAAVGGIVSSAYGMAGQRCLAGSRVIAVGAAYDALVEQLPAQAGRLVVGSGLEPGTDVGPVISRASLDRIERGVEAALAAGGTALLDGRAPAPQGPDVDGGFYVGPTVLADVDSGSSPAREELFGPVVVLDRVATLEEAIARCNDTDFGNSASIFTSAGGAARAFQRQVDAGNIGVNIGVAAPVSLFPLGGRGASFFGSTHVAAEGAVAFYTDPKVTITRWP